MKKLILLFCLSVFSFAAFSAPSPMADFPPGLSGDYVVYRDWSWELATWVGFLQYDETTFGALAVTPDSGANVSILFRCEFVDGKMILTGQQIISAITPKDVETVNYLMDLLPELHAWRASAARNGTKVSPGKASSGKDVPSSVVPRSSLLPSAVKTAFAAPNFGGDVVCTWVPEVPVFNLASMSGKDGKARLSLDRMGRIQAGGEADFFGYKPVLETKNGAPLTVPTARATETRTVDGVKLALDGQWTMVADNTFFLGNSAVLIVDTLDLSLMQIPRDNLVLSMVRLFSLSGAAAVSFPGDLSVTGTANLRYLNPLGSTQVLPGNRFLTVHDAKLCVPSSDGKKCTVVSLSVSEIAYRANKAYFDSLF